MGKNSHLVKDNLNQKYVDWAVDQFNEQYQDGAGFERLKELMHSKDPEDICQVQTLVYEFVQKEMSKQTGIAQPLHYQDPNMAYADAQASKVDRNEKLQEIFGKYSENAESIHQDYGSIKEHKEKLQKAYEHEKEVPDTHAYFTKAGIRYHRKATVNQFDIERQKGLLGKARRSTSSREETSKDYELSVPFFWRGDE